MATVSPIVFFGGILLACAGFLWGLNAKNERATKVWATIMMIGMLIVVVFGGLGFGHILLELMPPK